MATDTDPPAKPAHGDDGLPATILEIRVHGVSNTPPASMLGLETDEVIRCGGDDLGSFWTLTPAAEQMYAEPDGTAAGPAHRKVPPGVRREAYSWGGLARLAKVPGVTAVPGIVRGIIRAFWVFIIPFGMVNVAYWARDLDEPERRGPRILRTGSGGLVRLAGLTLTLLWVATAATVTLGVLAAQCYVPAGSAGSAADGDGGSTVIACTALPDALNFLATWSTGARTALFALLAALALAFLGAVASTGIVRYERVVSPQRQADKDAGTVPPVAPSAGWPWLARTGFWDHVRASVAMWMDHMAAGLTLITILVSWQMLKRALPDCPSVGNYLTPQCHDLAGTPDDGKSWFPLVLIGWGLLAAVVARVAWLQVEPSRTTKKVWRPIDAGLLAAALALFVWCEAEVVTSVERPLAVGDPTTFAGLEVVPAVLIATLVLLCLAAVGLRGRLPAAAWAPLVLAGIGAVIMTMVSRDAQDTADERRWATAALALLVVLGIAAFAANLRAEHRSWNGWGGRGPAVFLALASGFGMMLSGATVVGVVAWLETSKVPSAVTRSSPQTQAAGESMTEPIATTAGGSLDLWTPEGYREFAAMSLAVIIALVGAALVLTVRTFVGSTAIPDLPFGGLAPADDDTPAERLRKIARTRRVATLAHRAERIVGWLAAAFWLALVATLLVRPAGTPESSGTVPSLVPLWGWLDEVGTWAILGGVGLLVASVVVAGSKQALVRPWGLLWDLMCFLPRVAHPFGPPCYAERAVPELRGRIDEWLGEFAPGDYTVVPPAGQGRVVLSAHSLGAVVCVATLLARWDPATGRTNSEKVAFLTFGTQLRSYFGRFFPELLGPAVLGTHPTAGARTWARDPWNRELDGRTVPAFGVRTLAGSLTPAGDLPGGRLTTTRWRSLWRRTDYLGFPVNGYFDRDSGDGTVVVAIDRMESEWDTSEDPARVATHGGDHKTPEYREQLDRLLTLMRAPVEPPG